MLTIKLTYCVGTVLNALDISLKIICAGINGLEKMAT